ncbi:dockerin type I domain-containing protein [Rosistilla carotiformis]|uniref:dockerin type I domain-containing protein n=1 Tax=Rosistilla carotiformis TaxID=2528017 RepID=UPI001E630948|nr:dockerin type I domain-containing protein [Rosistilla carotiformis]
MAVFHVTTFDDVVAASDGVLSLREAISLANGSPGADEITFFETVTQPIVLGLGELSITDSVTITGAGRGTTVIDANQQSRVLNVAGESVDVTLLQLTLTDGRTTGSNGFGETTHSRVGIRFDSAGTLALIDSTLSGNSTVNVTSITPGTVTIEESGSDVVVREGSTILFQGPAVSLAVLDFTGTNGDDTLLLNASFVDFPGTVGFHGGTGRDTLQIGGSGQSINTSDLPAGSINGLEVIDLRGTGDNQLSLSEQDVSAIRDAGQTLRIVKDFGDTIRFRSGTFKVDSSRVEDDQLIITAKSGSNTIEFVGAGWTNPLNHLDVNGSGTIEPIDALQILNELGRKAYVQPGTSALVAPESLGASFPKKFYDTSGDNQVSPIDALRIINALGRGEGEAPAGEAYVFAASPVNQDADEEDQHEAVDLAILQWLGER